MGWFGRPCTRHTPCRFSAGVSFVENGECQGARGTCRWVVWVCNAALSRLPSRLARSRSGERRILQAPDHQPQETSNLPPGPNKVEGLLVFCDQVHVGKMSVQTICPYFHQDICLTDEFTNFFVHLGTYPFSGGKCALHIFSRSAVCLFIVLPVSFTEHSLSISIRSNLSLFLSHIMFLVSYLKIHHLSHQMDFLL